MTAPSTPAPSPSVSVPSTIAVGDRVREISDLDPESVRVGSGTVLDVEDGIARVEIEPVLSFRTSVENLVVVKIVCSYAKEQWRKRYPGISGPVIVCDVHKKPGPGALYEVDDPTKVTDRCQGPW